MATPPATPPSVRQPRAPIFSKAKLISLTVLSVLFLLCLLFSWNSRSSITSLSIFGQKGHTRQRTTKKPLVDVSPWQTAQTLAAMAVTAEEMEYARNAERLADHEVDQAFASALRDARLRAEHTKLTGEALALSQKVAQLQQLIVQDQALVQSLTPSASPSTGGSKAGTPPADDSSDDLDVAKAQLGLDTDELADAQEDLDRASGDDSSQIQQELNAHEEAMKQYDSESHSAGVVAAISVKQHGTLASRIQAWFRQIDRLNLIQQAQQQAQSDVSTLTAQHNALEAQMNGASATSQGHATDYASRIEAIKDKSTERQILSITDDRIQTQQQLAAVYGKWASQVQAQHSAVLRLILQSISVIILIAMCMLLGDTLVRQLMTHPILDRRQTQTLRSIAEIGIQVVGVVLILLVIFGAPQETPTILGLATAALTIALQDFILAFLGWFFLVGKNGLHVGDWVEINGVGGEVTEIGLFSTSLLETGTQEDKGYPTGRRISFMNSFAIRGQYFNFSTAGQWMWDEIAVSVPSSSHTHIIVEKIQKLVADATEENVRLAESEWRRGTHGGGLSRFTADPVVNLRPTGSGIDTVVRYVTRASERFELRNRIYQRIVDLLQQPGSTSNTQGAEKA